MIEMITNSKLINFDLYALKESRKSLFWFYVLFESSVLFVVFLLFIYFQLAPFEKLPVVDGFYHFRVSERIWESSGFWYSIPWLPYSVLGEQGPDHHWLWHLLLAPATQLPFDQTTCLKIVIAYGAAIVPFGLNVFFRMSRVPFSPIWVVLCLFSHLMLPGRLLMLKAQCLVLVLLCLYLFFAARGRWIQAGIVSFITMATYHGAIILVPVAVLSIVAIKLIEGSWQLKVLLGTAVGLFAALIINPWYPDNISYLLFQVFYKQVFPAQGIGVGAEWMSIPWRTYLKIGWLALAATGISAILQTLELAKLKRKLNVDALLLLFTSILFAGLSLKSMRFVEYFGPLSICTLALSCRPFIVEIQFFKKAIVAVILIALIAVNFNKNMNVVRASLVGDPKLFEEIYDYLEEFGKEGDVVFTGGWGNLPQHVWQSPKFRYVNGLDPNYLAHSDKQKFSIWLMLRKGDYPDNLDVAKVVHDVFNARWLITSSERMALLLRHSPDASYVISDSKGNHLFKLDMKTSEIKLEGKAH